MQAKYFDLSRLDFCRVQGERRCAATLFALGKDLDGGIIGDVGFQRRLSVEYFNVWNYDFPDSPHLDI